MFMTKVYQVNFTKEKLAAMPADERRLLLLLGAAFNEINVLINLILMASQATPDLKLVDDVQTGQVFVLIRTLGGKLYEAWDLFTKRFQSAPLISAKYRPRLNAEATTALEGLNKHFGRGSPLYSIRNAFCFHYDDKFDLVEKSFQDIPDDEPWRFYLSDTLGNCFYYASELVIEDGVIKAANPARIANAPYLEQSARDFKEL